MCFSNKAWLFKDPKVDFWILTYKKKSKSRGLPFQTAERRWNSYTDLKFQSIGAWHANHRLLYQIVRFPAKMQSHSWREQEKTISKPRFHIWTFIILYIIGNSNDVSTSTHGSRGKHLVCRLSWCQSGINNFVKELSQDMWGTVEEEFLLPRNK